MATGITFDGNDLQTASVVSQEINHYDAPDKDAPIYPIAHANKSSMPFSNFPSRKIVLSGYIKSDTVANLDSLVDTFKGYFINDDANLDIDYAGGTRRFIASVATPPKIDPELTTARFEVEFVCTDPFGRATSTSSLVSANGRTLHTYNDAITVLGNAKWQLPIITITINSVTDGDGHIRITNNATGQGILLIGQTFSASDVIIINSATRKVTLNGTEIDFLGSFPEFNTGSQQINYEDGFTAVNFDYDVDQYAYYL